MTPEQKRQKLKELNEKASARILTEENGDPIVGKSVYIWINGKPVLVPEQVAIDGGHSY